MEPAHLTVSFLGVTGLLALSGAAGWSVAGPGMSAWLGWTVSMLERPDVLRDVGLMTVFSTLLAFHWMNVYQPRVSASRAALIYLLEPVFASAFSILWGHDRLTPQLVFGGALILGGNLLVEVAAWRRVSPGERASEPGLRV